MMCCSFCDSLYIGHRSSTYFNISEDIESNIMDHFKVCTFGSDSKNIDVCQSQLFNLMG